MTEQQEMVKLGLQLARIEGKIDNFAESQARMSAEVGQHVLALQDHGNRLVALETTIAPIPAQITVIEARKYVSPAMAISALGLAFAALVALATVIAYLPSH
jgi:hypothetical protein